MTDHSIPTVAVFAATRADLSPLGPVLALLDESPSHRVVLVASSAVGSAEHGNPLADLGLHTLEVRWLRGDLAQTSVSGQTRAGAELSSDLSRVLDEVRPDAFVVLGDRWELLFVVPPVVVRGVPLVHLHGGEVTEGAIDDRVRHAVTKLADIHCVSTEDAADRVRQLGEPASRVFVTGAPGLDRVVGTRAATGSDLAELLGRPVRRPLALVTYHPVTVGGLDPRRGAVNVFSAVAKTCGSAIITHPGMDKGRDAVLEELRRVTTAQDGMVEVPALGRRYLSVLGAVDVVVGNSSSGVVEAASFGTPVVNIGDRQRGRPTGANVITCGESEEAIEAAIRTCLKPDFAAAARQVVNIYGDGHSAPRVVAAIDVALLQDLARKPFVDLKGRIS